ncbi:hypothetical protein TrVE_jg12227 [Triparma verrucosa]|uniref:Uncharacterized protein n=2 Tax=Triparma TaxID=722752 RepID=A0A9W6ZFW2_9STRA|nr:hypothetical protein TrST_g8709 [Triparma strigata]GMI00385.1 hypothetical protein TrVE_jg12227 [Triparma verrucosa]
MSSIRVTSLNARISKLALSNPLNSILPWEKEKEKEKEMIRMRIEGAKLYRTLGVSEDATYEEITEAAQGLESKYSTDLKKKIKITVTREKIMELRLRQRVSGNLAVDSWARDMDSAEKTLASRKKVQFKPPAWTSGVMVMPDQVHLKSTSTYLGGTSLGCLLLPNLSTSFIMLASMCSLGLLYNRGAPDVPKDDMGQPGEVRSPNPVSVGLTVGLVFGWAAVAAVAGTVVMSVLPGLRRFFPENLFVNLSINLGFWIAATFFKTYKQA